MCTLRINLIVTAPLTENMPGPSATKPGDMWVLLSTLGVKELMTFFYSIYAMNGKSVEVDNTDAEGRLVLSGMIPFSDIV
jgi:aminopeptidase